MPGRELRRGRSVDSGGVRRDPCRPDPLPDCGGPRGSGSAGGRSGVPQRRVYRRRQGMNRDARIGMNEAVFRSVNERIQEVANAFQLNSEPLDLICECGNASCVERISLTPAEYEELRSNAHQFAVAPGHETQEVETVIARRPGYDLVAKNKGIPEQIAEDTDPRRDE